MLRNDPGLEIMNSRVVIQINILDFLLDWNPFHRKFRTKVHSNFGRIMENVFTSLGNLGKTKKRQTSNATGERQKEKKNDEEEKKKRIARGGERWQACTSMETSDGQTCRNLEGASTSGDKVDSPISRKPGSLVQGATKLNVTIATDAEGWNKSVNEQYLLKIAQNSQVRVTGLVPKHTQEQKLHAKELKIELVDAKDIAGYLPVDCLAFPPDSLDIDILIIHSYGRDLGRQAQIIKDTKQCLWVNVVHTVSEDLEKYLDKKSADPAANGQITEHELQIILCEKSDIIFAIGPKVTEAYKSALLYSDKHKSVINLTPGIIEEFDDVRCKIKDPLPDNKFRVLLSASSKYFSVKGCDIAAAAIKLLKDSSYRLIFVRQPKDKEDELKKKLNIDEEQLTFKESSGNIDFWKKLLCEVDLVIKPSRTEGFGISGLRAISANRPVLVSRNCGLGMVLMELRSGAQHVIDSKDPQDWANAIKNVRAKAVQVRREESERLRQDYKQKFNWKMQCDEIVKKLFSMKPHKSEHRKEPVEGQSDVAETTRDLQSPQVNRDDVDGERSIPPDCDNKQNPSERSIPPDCDNKQNPPEDFKQHVEHIEENDQVTEFQKCKTEAMVNEERAPENVNPGSQELRLVTERKINQTEGKGNEEMEDAPQRGAQELSIVTGKFESKRMDYKEKVEIVQERTQEVGHAAAKEFKENGSGFDQADGGAATLDSVNDSKSNRNQTGKPVKVQDIPYSILRQICMKLNIKNDLSFKDFRLLGEKMGFDKDLTKVLEQKSNPSYELFQMWHSNPKSTVENLLMILKDDDMGRWDVATILEDWLEIKINN